MSQSVIERQLSTVFVLQGRYAPPQQATDGSFSMSLPPTGATVDGNGHIVRTEGFNGALLVYVIEQIGGTATLSLQSSLTAFLDNPGGSYPPDHTAIGYTTLSVVPRVVSISNISVTPFMRASFLIVDPYPYVRGVLSAMSSAQVEVLLYAVAA